MGRNASSPDYPDPLPHPNLAGTRIVGLSGRRRLGRRSILLQPTAMPFMCCSFPLGGYDDAYCTTARRFPNARRVCAKLGIFLQSVSCCRALSGTSVSAFPARIRRRPNPDPERPVQSGTQVRRPFWTTGTVLCLLDRQPATNARLRRIRSGRNSSSPPTLPRIIATFSTALPQTRERRVSDWRVAQGRGAKSGARRRLPGYDHRTAPAFASSSSRPFNSS